MGTILQITDAGVGATVVFYVVTTDAFDYVTIDTLTEGYVMIGVDIIGLVDGDGVPDVDVEALEYVTIYTLTGA